MAEQSGLSEWLLLGRLVGRGSSKVRAAQRRALCACARLKFPSKASIGGVAGPKVKAQPRTCDCKPPAHTLSGRDGN